jgi:CHAT domain-containing protein
MEALSHYFKNVTRYSDRHALKANFIDQAPKHDLIHLGIHGVGDPVVADNSRLVFRSDSSGSGDLYAYEIYNLKISASLVVLSACETGLGKRQTGEGILSIARAFAYAGSPSVVMSMWRVNDTFTASIMQDFYKNLSEGDAVSASLRNSKKKFLQQADGFSAHPSNWAAFVLNGQDQSVVKKTLPVPTLLIIFALGLILSYLMVKKKRIFL